MSGTTLALLGATALAVAAALTYWRWKRSLRRREELFVLANARGWEFLVRDATFVPTWQAEPFGRGERQRATNVLRGTAHGRPLLAFDYAYDQVTRDRRGAEVRRTTRFAVVVVGLPTYLPRLVVTPEHMLHRAADAAGASTDLELESDAFNRRYRIDARSPKFASDVLSPRTMALMLSREPLAFRFEGTDAISWERGGLTAIDLVRRVSTLNAVLDGIPRFVWRDHGVDAQ